MDKLIFEIDEEMAIMEKYELSPNEVFLTRILLLAKENYSENYINRFMNLPDSVRGGLISLLTRLQDKGVILKSYKLPKVGGIFDPYEVEFNKNIIKSFHRAAFDMGKELFDTYPMFGKINGCTVSLRGVSKKFDSLEDFYRYYGKTIRWNPETHKKILDLIVWAKDYTNFLNMSISTFVIEHKWEEILALKDGKVANINFDTIKLL